MRFKRMWNFDAVIDYVCSCGSWLFGIGCIRVSSVAHLFWYHAGGTDASHSQVALKCMPEIPWLWAFPAILLGLRTSFEKGYLFGSGQTTHSFRFHHVSRRRPSHLNSCKFCLLICSLLIYNWYHRFFGNTITEPRPPTILQWSWELDANPFAVLTKLFLAAISD